MPVAGLVLAILFAGGGAYFQWCNPKIMMGLGRFFAFLLWALAVIGALAATFGFPLLIRGVLYMQA